MNSENVHDIVNRVYDSLSVEFMAKFRMTFTENVDADGRMDQTKLIGLLGGSVMRFTADLLAFSLAEIFSIQDESPE
jgi:hypothetical protein